MLPATWRLAVLLLSGMRALWAQGWHQMYLLLVQRLLAAGARQAQVADLQPLQKEKGL
jgi:hypothetical protein